VTLAATPQGHTSLSYEYGADIGGQLAAFGQRMLDGVVRVLVASFFERLSAHVQGKKPAAGRVARWRSLLRMLKLLRGRR
jgi:hypothetical protein